MERTPTEVLDEARWADATGWHGFWIADHYLPDSGDETPLDGPIHECWSLLPAVAAVTTRLRLGPLVSPTSVHHPALLANRAATIDHLSGGRFVLGIGAGWQINEHAAYGIPLEPAGQRVSRFEEAIRIVRSLLTERRTTLHGSYYSVTDAPCDPKPVQSPLPILVGARGARMLRIAARHAQEWNAWGDPDTAIARRASLMATCEEMGRDPGTMHTSVNAFIALDAEPVQGRPTLAGSADRIVDQLGRYAEAGYDEFIVPEWNLSSSAAERADQLDRIKTEVVDRLG